MDITDKKKEAISNSIRYGLLVTMYKMDITEIDGQNMWNDDVSHWIWRERYGQLGG